MITQSQEAAPTIKDNKLTQSTKQTAKILASQPPQFKQTHHNSAPSKLHNDFAFNHFDLPPNYHAPWVK